MDPRLIGTWRLISVTAEDIDTGERRDTWGPDPLGFITYGADGRMMVINARSDRNVPEGAVATDAEAAGLFRSMLAYAGRYTIDGDLLTHHIDISWNEAWTGLDQVRKARFEGNRVHLSTLPNPDPVNGRISVRTMIWEKLG